MRSDPGRHQLAAARRPRRGPLAAALGTAIFVGAALAVPAGAHGADPIDAEPVTTFATVISAPSCTAATVRATVELVEPALLASLDACGLPPGQRVVVEHLRGTPGVVRLAGTRTSGADTESGRWVAVGLGVLALLTVLAVVVLCSAHRRGRPDDRTVTVAELVERLATPSPPPSARVLETAGRP